MTTLLAVDSSTFIAFLAGEKAKDTLLLKQSIIDSSLRFPPLVLSELLSDSTLSEAAAEKILNIPLIEILPGFWERTGKNRATLLSHRLKARTADALIAQSCIDHKIPLITRDKDFRHYAKWCGLTLA